MMASTSTMRRALASWREASGVCQPQSVPSKMAQEEEKPLRLKRLISGGQTGADQAGLYAGELLGLETGGMVPKGWRTADGPNPELGSRFGCEEHTSANYPPRTEGNVLLAGATVLFGDMSSPGCSLTIRLCQKHKRPYVCNPTAEQLQELSEIYETLNIAGNRERTNRGIFMRTLETLMAAFDVSSAERNP